MKDTNLAQLVKLMKRNNIFTGAGAFIALAALVISLVALLK